MNNIAAIFKKQLKDTLRNKTVLIQFVMFPIMTLIMNNAIKMQEMPENFFVNLFATMYIGMAPLTSIASIISEEKEKNTLRVLIMSNVKPYEFLLGIGSYVWFACMLGGIVICTAGGYNLQAGIAFMCIMAIGILTSLLIGAIIGIWSKTQMMATSIAVPVMVVFAFVPMLSLFNSTIEKIARVIYSEQISRMFSQINSLQLNVGNVGVIVMNIFIAAVIFIIIFKKCKLS
ncbi:MAG: ABC transporter permease [Roseburia sp.]|nr:ABC transporter permease [Roseburia sp.]